MEKPFVAGSANAEHLIARAEGKGLHLAVSYQRHLEGPYMYLHDLVSIRRSPCALRAVRLRTS